jgi:hypothetical protein
MISHKIQITVGGRTYELKIAHQPVIKDYVLVFYYHLLILMVYHLIFTIWYFNGLFLFTLCHLYVYFPYIFCSYYLSHHIIAHKILFWKSIHLEVASESFCFLINSSWLLIFTLIIILFIFTGFNLYCWTGIHFS